MPVSSVQSGYPIIQQSRKMADEAAVDIGESTFRSNELSQSGALEFNDVENTKIKRLDENNASALIKLNQATQYNRVGTSVMQREQDMIGSLLDLHV